MSDYSYGYIIESDISSFDTDEYKMFLDFKGSCRISRRLSSLQLSAYIDISDIKDDFTSYLVPMLSSSISAQITEDSSSGVQDIVLDFNSFFTADTSSVSLSDDGYSYSYSVSGLHGSGRLLMSYNYITDSNNEQNLLKLSSSSLENLEITVTKSGGGLDEPLSCTFVLVPDVSGFDGGYAVGSTDEQLTISLSLSGYTADVSCRVPQLWTGSPLSEVPLSSFSTSSSQLEYGDMSLDTAMLLAAYKNVEYSFVNTSADSDITAASYDAAGGLYMMSFRYYENMSFTAYIHGVYNITKAVPGFSVRAADDKRLSLEVL